MGRRTQWGEDETKRQIGPLPTSITTQTSSNINGHRKPNDHKKLPSHIARDLTRGPQHTHQHCLGGLADRDIPVAVSTAGFCHRTQLDRLHGIALTLTAVSKQRKKDIKNRCCGLPTLMSFCKRVYNATQSILLTILQVDIIEKSANTN